MVSPKHNVKLYTLILAAFDMLRHFVHTVDYSFENEKCLRADTFLCS